MSCEECLTSEFSFNSAKKELEAKIKELEEKLKIKESKIIELENSLFHKIRQNIDSLDKIGNLGGDIDRAVCFLKLLDRYPCFWGWTYKKNIKQFLIDNNYVDL